MNKSSRIGIDLGRVLVGPKNEDGQRLPIPDSFTVVKKIINKCGPENVFIVSRVNSEQRERAMKWLLDNDFYYRTGFLGNNLYFCFDRRDKSMFATGLNLDYFIDDRPDCLLPMKDVVKILFNPWPGDLEKFKTQIEENNNLGIDRKLKIMNNWKEIEKFFNL